MVYIKDEDGNTRLISEKKFKSGNYKAINSGYITVKDKKSILHYIDPKDPRYLNGEFEKCSLVPVKDKHGNYFRVDLNDPRYLSGELMHI